MSVITNSELLNAIRTALSEAMCTPPRQDWRGTVNGWRSHTFVAAVADYFRCQYAEGYAVFSRDHGENRQHFGLNELLFDVSVCHVQQSPSGLRYVARAEWLVESEFGSDLRGVLRDFGKLNMGAAPNRLFVGSRDWRTQLSPCFDQCGSGRMLLAQVPHPQEWGPGAESKVSLWDLTDSRYRNDATH